jgi:dTDP-6-deoxy-L-talose 4-dehydrogenase (NAD+)
MRVLVTGATGFIGGHVVEYLLNSGGHTIVTTATKSKIDAESAYPYLKDTEYIPKDLNKNEENFYTFFRKPDCLIHLSWEGLPNYNGLFHTDKNFFVNYYFLKNMIQNGLLDVTVAGTCFEYGMQNGCLHEGMNTMPATIYGLAKDTLRKFLETLQSRIRFDMKWIRIFYPYGKGQNGRSLYSQMEKAILNKNDSFNMSFGEQIRDYLPINKVAEYISKIALQNSVVGIINCCSGKPISVLNFVESFFTEHGYVIKLNRGVYPYIEYEPFAFWGDNRKLINILGGELNVPSPKE